jgi:uncharacterized membrane protein YqjE
MSEVIGEAKNHAAHGAGPQVMDAATPPADEAAAVNLTRSVRELFSTLLEGLRTRLNLAAVELEIYLRALLTVLLYAVCAIACIMLGLALAAVTLVVALWNTHRLLALLSGSLAFAALAVLFAFLSVRCVSSWSTPRRSWEVRRK